MRRFRRERANIFLVLVLAFTLVVPQQLFSQWVVFDISAYWQRYWQYIQEFRNFLEEITQIYEEVRLLTDQLTNIKSIKSFTDDFMELYQFSLELLDSSSFQNILHKDISFTYTSPQSSDLMTELAGTPAGEYQAYLEASKHLGGVRELHRVFSQAYWNVETIRAEIEKAFPEDSEEKERLHASNDRLGAIEGRIIDADAAVSRVNEYLAGFEDETLKEYNETLKNAADNPTKLAQVQAAGIGNLQKLSSQQVALQAKTVALLSELLAEKGFERKKAIELQLQQKKLTGRKGRTKEEYDQKVKETTKSLANALKNSGTWKE